VRRTAALAALALLGCTDAADGKAASFDFYVGG